MNNQNESKVEAEDVTKYTQEEKERISNTQEEQEDYNINEIKYCRPNEDVNGNPNDGGNDTKIEVNSGVNIGDNGGNNQSQNQNQNNNIQINQAGEGELIHPELEEKKYLNPDYFDEFGRPKYEEVVKYENELRAQIEQSSPLVSDIMDIGYLTVEFKESQFENSIAEIVKKYKSIRTVRRDGNCFYRSYLFRLFEELSINKNSALHSQVVKTVEDSKNLCEKNGYQWLVFEDFYNVFISEWKFVYQLDPTNAAEYLKLLFQDKEKCNYMIVFIRIFIAAYIKENRFLYEAFVDEDLDYWCLKEVEAVDNECDQVQILAVVNAFNIGVIIENLNITRVDTMKFPEEMEKIFIHMLFRPGHYDILYPY